jgi:serine/threonine protein kinase
MLAVDSQVELIPGYRLIQRLGAGGFGEVWKAEAPGGLLKAVKIIHGLLSNCMLDETRLKQELKAIHRVKSIRHPYLLSLERFDIIDGRLIIVSELADCTLMDRLKDFQSQGHTGIPRLQLLGYMKEAAEVLDLMNIKFNLQHLDIKPQNIFLLYNHVKVGDFGLVKDLAGMFAAVTSGVTAVYAAPETFEGVVTRFCDQYNLAIAYQEMLTGKLPFDGTTGPQLMKQHVMGVPNLTSLPQADQPVVARALAKKPEERFASCLDFVQALCQAGGSTAELAIVTNLVSSVEIIAETPRPAAALESAEALTTHVRPNGRRAHGADAPPVPPQPPEALTSPSRPNGRRPAEFVSPPATVEEKPEVATAAGESVAEEPEEQPLHLVEYVPPPPPPERAETTGDGILFPALVLGLGGLGREVLKEVRTSLRKRGPTETWPHIRLLNVDTNPAWHERATREPNSVLTAEEFLVVHFHRPSHYLKRQREREQLERWLPLNRLTTVAHGQVTADGWRALGRLAFVSSKNAAARLHQELEACANESALKDAARRTSLGLRSTRPRVYVVTSLSGGTGSGMFVDVADALRQELAQVGHPRAELVGVFLVPAVKGKVDAHGVANAYAALTELKRDAAERAAAGAAPPFDRCIFLPLPAKSEGDVAVQELVSLAGEFLSRELTTPLGRVADDGRSTSRPAAARMTCQTFGAYWFSVPRRPLLRHVIQRLCDRMMRGWGVCDADVMAASARFFAHEQLTRVSLSSETLITRLQEGCAEALGQPRNSWLAAHMQTWAKGQPGDLGSGGAAVRQAVAEMEHMLGHPEREPDLQFPSPVLTALAEAARGVANEADGHLTELVMATLCEPRFRLACQEEAVQAQLLAALDESAQRHRQRSSEQRNQALAFLQQLPPHLSELHTGGIFRGRARARAADAIRTLLGKYLLARWDSVLALTAHHICRELHANLPRHRRTVNCCHKRLNQFLETFDAAANDAPVDLGLGRYLLPFGCQTLDEAVACILDNLPQEEENALHQRIWKHFQATFQENVHVCTAPTSLMRGMREHIDRETEQVAEDSLGRAHAAQVYLERQAEYPDADSDLSGAFDEAKPELAHGPRQEDQEFSILAVPVGPEGDRFRALVEHALPDVSMRTAVSTDDIVFYREHSFAGLDELPQLSSAAREHYKHILATAQFGPHSRSDVVW